MVSIDSNVVIPIFVVCGVLLVFIVVLLIYYCCHTCRRRDHDKSGVYSGFKRRDAFDLSCVPPPGVYRPPVEVRLRSSSSSSEPCDILLDVQRVTEDVARAGVVDATRRLDADEYDRERFLLYADPLEFVEAGRYIVRAYAVCPRLRIVGSVRQFCFDVVDRSDAEAQRWERHVDSGRRSVAAQDVSPLRVDGHVRPLPPRIIPRQGQVTTSTPITIAPHEDSDTPDQIRYSLDGSHPSLLYTGPFTLSLPPLEANGTGRRLPVVVRAVSVSAFDGGLKSAVTEAVLSVCETGHSFYDPNVPAPVARVHAVGAEMYFDESQRPPNTSIIYRLVYITEARQKPKFSRRNGIVYDGRPVPLREDVAFVYAWTFVDSHDNGRQQIYPVHVEDEDGGRMRSSAAVYDCARAVSWNRGPREGEAMNALPPPVICVRCREMEVYFEDPPAGGIICYTLDGTAPAPPSAFVTMTHMAEIGFSGATHSAAAQRAAPGVGTHVYRGNQPICVTLLRTEQVLLTAQTFIPSVDHAAGGAVTGYRYGGRFNRSFTTQ